MNLKNNIKISIVIVTRNRQDHLQRCLASLLFQTVTLDELVIIDNNSTDQTANLVTTFKKKVTFPVILILEKKVGYPFVYNRGLKNASQSWVVFIDDDCVANDQWLEQIHLFLRHHQEASVVLNESQTITTNNIFSLTTYILDQHWKKNGIQGEKVIDYEILDNKNIVYNKQFLTEHRISFDEKRVRLLNGAAEDSDLGKQIQTANGAAFYNKYSIVKHQDPTNLQWYLKRYFHSYAAYLFLKEKWSDQAQRNHHIQIKKILAETISKNQLGFLQQIGLCSFLFIVVSGSILLSKLMSHPQLRKLFLAYFS